MLVYIHGSPGVHTASGIKGWIFLICLLFILCNSGVYITIHNYVHAYSVCVYSDIPNLYLKRIQIHTLHILNFRFIEKNV